jgi:hypothetical protein
MVNVTAADEFNAGLFMTPDFQHFAAFKPNGIHPDAANSERRMMEKEQHMRGVTSLYHTSGPVNLCSTNPAGHRTGQMGIQPKAQPTVCLKRECHRLLSTAGRNAVRKRLPEELSVVVIPWDLPQPIPPGPNEVCDSRVTFRQFIVGMVASDDNVIRTKAAILNMPHDLQECFVCCHAAKQRSGRTEEMEIGKLKDQSHGRIEGDETMFRKE